MLTDLILSGVKWELKNGAAENKAQKTNIQNIKDTLNLQPLTVNPNYAPAVAPNVESINDLDTLAYAIANFNHPLKQFSKTIIPKFVGNNSKLLIITDMPSGDDERNGAILTGGAGELMDKMLSAIGLSRDDVSIIPLLFWRTPGGRTPTDDELELARPIINKSIELLKPAVILTLGTLATMQITGAKLPNNNYDLHFTIGDLSVPVFTIFHPNYIMLKPDSKKIVWETLQALQKILQN